MNKILLTFIFFYICVVPSFAETISLKAIPIHQYAIPIENKQNYTIIMKNIDKESEYTHVICVSMSDNKGNIVIKPIYLLVNNNNEKYKKRVQGLIFDNNEKPGGTTGRVTSIKGIYIANRLIDQEAKDLEDKENEYILSTILDKKIFTFELNEITEKIIPYTKELFGGEFIE